MGIKIISTVDIELTIPVRGGTVTLTPATLFDADPRLAKELENTAPVRRVSTTDPAYSETYSTLAVTEG